MAKLEGSTEQSSHAETLCIRASDQVRQVCATAHIRVQRTGKPIDKEDAIQLGTVSSATDPTTTNAASTIPGYMTELTQPQSSFSRFSCQLDILRKHKKAKIAGAQPRYKVQLQQNRPTYAAILPWKTRLH